ncbi:nitric oxide-associated protein 1-like isoform X2 [Portunus trituberculatus]|nr:nitric oxide-associated protein 1-like isoform X2 [Portunus trituberculatus]
MLALAIIQSCSKSLLRQTFRHSYALIDLSELCYSRSIHEDLRERHVVVTQQQIEEGNFNKGELPFTVWALTDSRILYSSHVKNSTATDNPLVLNRIGKQIQEQKESLRKKEAIPLIIEHNIVKNEEKVYIESASDEKGEKSTFFFPYAHTHEIEIPESYVMDSDPVKSKFTDSHSDFSKLHVSVVEEIALRMKAYDEGILEEIDAPKGNLVKDENTYDLPNDILLEEGAADLHLIKEQQGSADPKCPISDIPCGGCGAFLHCQQPSLMGFVPKELFEGRNSGELRSILCQRCYFLKIHKTALSVKVDPNMYEKLLEPIKQKRALVLLVVDLLDVPCSIWPNIMDIIGTSRPVMIVGNKVDLLPSDGKNHHQKVKDSLIASIEKTPLSQASIKHVALVSAHTGYGIESLITKIQKYWSTKGDIYILGCTNSGKSTLFNALLGSDLCKTDASTLIQRATVSPWPGTTLNMLKFPILRPSGHLLYLRTQRLKKEQRNLAKEDKPRFTNNMLIGTLTGHIGRTLEKKEKPVVKQDPFSTDMRKPPADTKSVWGINPKHKQYALSKWCYDTPGTVQPEQMIHLLTHKELMKVLPCHLLHPETFCLQSGYSLLLAGLARLDLLYSPASVRFTVFRSSGLPLTICKTVDASSIYCQYLGSPILGVPCGGEERLKSWPPLQPVNLRVQGHRRHESCVDVVLSSAGWVSLTNLKEDQIIELRAWSPTGRGIHLRDPPLLPRAVTLRGRRIGKSLTYRPHKIFVPQ